MDNNNGFNVVSYRTGINKATGKSIAGALLDYEEAEKIVVDYITEKKKEEIEKGQVAEVKTKEDLRHEKQKVRKWVSDCLVNSNISIRGYQDDKITDFIEQMVGEYAGYSILEEAFADDDVSDIYCIDYKTIFVEKNGKNERYPHQFKSPEHYKNVVERFIRTNGKEINNGENKIVDFEMYGDRGCATCPVVSPRDYSLTMRKHQEDHIILDQLLEWECMSEEMKDFFGLVINGEGNLIYAGLTGSGKTTSIRAMIDYFVTKNNRRMLVCEDTQELFPTNEHTLELVSIKTDKKETSIPLEALIVTALRLKPKYIVVGEVRAAEAQAAVEAMETGHSTIFTMHGGTPINIVNRLVTKYLMAMPELGIDVVERIIGSAVDYIAVQDNIPGIGRKVSIIEEINYDFDKQRVKLVPIFRFDFEKRDFVMLNRLGEDKISKFMRRGVPREEAMKWLRTDDEETERKAVAEINERYFAEKEERRKMYKERKEKREAEKKAKKEHATETDAEKAHVLQRARINEQQKKLEIQDMLEKTARIKDTEDTKK